MTYRDDHDAAIARADALEGEVDQLKSERDQLEAKIKQLETEKQAAQKPKPENKKPKRARSDSESSKDDDGSGGKVGKIGGLILVAIVAGVAAIALMGDCNQRKKIEEWDKKTAERTAYAERWSALADVEPCVRMIAYDGMQVRENTPDKKDPRKEFIWSFTDRLAGNCLHGAGELVKDPKTSPRLRGALQAFLDVQGGFAGPGKALGDYYSNNDWKEDNFANAPKLWEPVLALLDKQVQAMARLRREAFPEIATEIRAMQKAHEAKAGRDETWWRVELAMQLRAICDKGYDAAGVYAGKHADHAAGQLAIKEPVTALLAAVANAPIELRRIVRKVDYLTTPIAAGTPYMGETPLWHLCNLERDLITPGGRDAIPALPPDPGPRPEEPSD